VIAYPLEFNGVEPIHVYSDRDGYLPKDDPRYEWAVMIADRVNVPMHALETMRCEGTIRSWQPVAAADRRQSYLVHGAQPDGRPFAGVVEVELLPARL
jgi:hypothetical protein